MAVTHIHLDHAGGVGDVAAAFPQATVYVHERGARHLVDPTKLVNCAAMVYGDLLDSLYGRLTPTEAARVRVLEDGDEVVVSSNRTLTTVDSPGHAKHHLALHDSDSGLLFAGDAVGVRLPDVGILRPATPPPDFDLDQALTSLRRFADRRPAGIALAHFGLVPDPAAILDEAQETLTRWAEVAEAAWRDGEDIADALAALRRRPRRRRPGAAREARDAQRHPLERRRLPPLARAGQRGRRPCARPRTRARAPASPARPRPWSRRPRPGW